ncbi:hypothetical protein I35_4120 [Burkholderia cenocepacia H111]|nr:hypothetical protein I35_4120 [Burkholderia cenocepacia H111]
MSLRVSSCKESTAKAREGTHPCRLRRVPPPVAGASDATEQHQYHDNDDDQPDGTRWPVAPASAVRPCRKCSDEQQNQNDDEDRTEHRIPPGFIRHGVGCRNSRAVTRLLLKAGASAVSESPEFMR